MGLFLRIDKSNITTPLQNVTDFHKSIDKVYLLPSMKVDFYLQGAFYYLERNVDVDFISFTSGITNLSQLTTFSVQLSIYPKARIGDEIFIYITPTQQIRTLECRVLDIKDNVLTLEKISYSGTDLQIDSFTGCAFFNKVNPKVIVSTDGNWDETASKFVYDLSYSGSGEIIRLKIADGVYIDHELLAINLSMVVPTGWFENINFDGNIKENYNKYPKYGYIVVGCKEMNVSYHVIEFLYPNFSTDNNYYKFDDFIALSHTIDKQETQTNVTTSYSITSIPTGYILMAAAISNITHSPEITEQNIIFSSTNFVENDLSTGSFTFTRYSDDDIAVVKFYFKNENINQYLVLTKQIYLGLYEIKAMLVYEHSGYYYANPDASHAYPWDAVAAYVDAGAVQVYKLKWWVEYTNGITSYSGEQLEYSVIDNNPKEVPWDGNTIASMSLYGINPYNLKILKLHQLGASEFVLVSYLVKYLNKSYLPDTPEAGYNYYLNIVAETSQGISVKKLQIPITAVQWTTDGLWDENEDYIHFYQHTYPDNFMVLTIQFFRDDFSNLTYYSHNEIHETFASFEDDYIAYLYNTDIIFIRFKKSSLPPGNYVAFVRFSSEPNIEIATYYNFTIKPPSLQFHIDENIPLPLSCSSGMPKLQNETIKYLSPIELTSCQQLLPYSQAGDYYQYEFTTDTCLDNTYESIVTVDAIPNDYVDITLFFNNRINDATVTGQHFFRVKGRIAFIDDDITEERYVDTNYDEPNIIRTFRQRLELTLFCDNALQLNSINFIKYAHHLHLSRRVGFPRNFYNFVFENISYTDVTDKLITTITLRSLHYRTEFRY